MWNKESERHCLAAKGIETTNKSKMNYARVSLTNSTIQKELDKVLQDTYPSGDFYSMYEEVKRWVSEEGFQRGFWLGLRNAGVRIDRIKPEYRHAYELGIKPKEKPKTTQIRAEVLHDLDKNTFVMKIYKKGMLVDIETFKDRNELNIALFETEPSFFVNQSGKEIDSYPTAKDIPSDYSKKVKFEEWK